MRTSFQRLRALSGRSLESPLYRPSAIRCSRHVVANRATTNVLAVLGVLDQAIDLYSPRLGTFIARDFARQYSGSHSRKP